MSEKSYLDDMINGALPYVVGAGLLWWLYRQFVKGTSRSSVDTNVNEAINILDACFNKVWYFDDDLEPIFEVLKGLNTAQILLLHKDFGTRSYNKLWGKYVDIPYLNHQLNLSGIMYAEFDKEQIQRVKDIYSSKMLTFPL